MALTRDFTFQYNEGIILNDDFVPGVPFVDITKVSGLDSGEFRVQDRPREGSDGGFMDTGFKDMRVIVLEGTVYGDESYLEQLKANWRPYRDGTDGTGGGAVFRWRADSLNRYVKARSLGIKYDWDSIRRTGSTAVQFQLKCEDPTIYSDPPITVGPMVLLALSVTGYGYPRAYNRTYGGGISGGSGTSIYNSGTVISWPEITITGPVVNPYIINDSWPTINVPRIRLAASLGVGDSVVINMRNRTVVLNGIVSRRLWVSPPYVWWGLIPGNNFIRFGADTSTAAEATLTYSHAYE